MNSLREQRKKHHFKVFPLECITELLSQTIANRDRQIEVVTQERQMRERKREDEKALGHIPAVSIPLLTESRHIEGRERRKSVGCS